MKVPDAFPRDDRLGQFVVAMAMAANDIEYALRRAVEANPDNSSDEDRERNRFSQRVRLAIGFLFEGVDALRSWRQHEPEVAKMLRGLDPDGARLLSLVFGLEQRIGSKALSRVRQFTFHYPHPDPRRTPDSTYALAEVLGDADDVQLSVQVGPGSEHSFPFADRIAVGLALGDRNDDRAQRLIRDGAVAFVKLVEHIWVAYGKSRGFQWGAMN